MNKYVVALGCSWKLFWNGGLWLSGLGGIVLAAIILFALERHWMSWPMFGMMAAFITVLSAFISLMPLWATLLQPPLFWLESRLKKLLFWTT